MGIEEFREQEIASRKVGIDPGQAERKAAQERIAANMAAATRIYQQEATPLEERVREVRLERPRTDHRLVDPGEMIARKRAREELAAEGFTEEQVETPYGELGTITPPFAQEPAPVPVVAPALLEEPVHIARATSEGIDVKVDSAAKKILLLAFLAKIVGAAKQK